LYESRAGRSVGLEHPHIMPVTRMSFLLQIAAVETLICE
jgi:hypothetical protein